MQARARAPDGAVRIDGCDDLAACVAGIGDFARCVWRTGPPAGPVEAARARRVCRRPWRQRLAEEIARVRTGRSGRAGQRRGARLFWPAIRSRDRALRETAP